MIIVALVVYGTQSLLAWNYWPLLNSFMVGLAFLGFGFLMYFLGQWGGGDAKILGAMGFLLPAAPSFISPNFFNLTPFFPFPFSFMVNVFLVGAAYMIIYAIVMALRNRDIVRKFKEDMAASCRFLLALSAALFAAFIAIGFALSNAFYARLSLGEIVADSILPLAATVMIFVVWKFARAVENVGFKRRVSVGRLKVGDVLDKSRLWEGITEKELRTLRRSKTRYVWVKEGVRFAPAFPLALLVTALFGDVLILLVRSLA